MYKKCDLLADFYAENVRKTMQLLERKIDAFLSEWKHTPKRKPLIVKGARQIGKTESIRAFGKANYESVVEINFVLQKKFRAIFDDGYEVDSIIKNISLLEPSWKFVPHNLNIHSCCEHNRFRGLIPVQFLPYFFASSNCSE